MNKTLAGIHDLGYIKNKQKEGKKQTESTSDQTK